MKKHISFVCFYLVLMSLITLPAFAESATPGLGCGLQCIRLLCKFYGKDFSKEKVSKLLKTNTLGECSIKDIERCLNRVGLKGYPFKGSVGDISSVNYPMILHFKKEQKDIVGHFLVALWSKKEQKLIGYDPAMSGDPFELTPDALAKFWTGKGLVILPDNSFPTKYVYFFSCCISLAIVFVIFKKRKNQNEKTV